MSFKDGKLRNQNSLELEELENQLSQIVSKRQSSSNNTVLKKQTFISSPIKEEMTITELSKQESSDSLSLTSSPMGKNRSDRNSNVGLLKIPTGA